MDLTRITGWPSDEGGQHRPASRPASRTFHVVWEFDSDADSPRAAALDARNAVVREGSIATVYHVSDGRGGEWTVDLWTGTVHEAGP